MNKTLITQVNEQRNKFHRFLIVNSETYAELKKELGLYDYEDMVSYKNLIICISKDDLIKIILI